MIYTMLRVHKLSLPMTIIFRSDDALLVCGDTTGKLCVLRVIEKAPGSVKLENTLRVRQQYLSSTF